MTAKRYRVPVDFTEDEREVLSVLCGKDYRTPEDQLRFLVVSEAQRRGLVKNEVSAQPPSTRANLAANA